MSELTQRTTLPAKSIYTPLLALDRLNSWIRSDRPWSCRARSALKPVIYWTKTQAILDMSRREHIAMRRVMVVKPCRRCEGTGTFLSDYVWNYYHYDGEGTTEELRSNYGERCWVCLGEGTVRLKFVATTIGPIRWHTPSEKWWSSGLEVYVPFPCFHGERNGDGYELATDWALNQPGRAMTMAEVQRDMLIVLQAWPHDVCFSIDFHHNTKFEPYYKCPRVAEAAAWIRELTQEGASV